LAIIETERSLVDVAKQMERFDRNTGAGDGALQQRPEILKAVGARTRQFAAAGAVLAVCEQPERGQPPLKADSGSERVTANGRPLGRAGDLAE
jgi:hypothetical protein